MSRKTAARLVNSLDALRRGPDPVTEIQQKIGYCPGCEFGLAWG